MGIKQAVIKDAMEREPICGGCSTFISPKTIKTKTSLSLVGNVLIQCQTPATFNGKNCPCSTCLVKMRCEDECLNHFMYSTWAKKESSSK